MAHVGPPGSGTGQAVAGLPVRPARARRGARPSGRFGGRAGRAVAGDPGRARRTAVRIRGLRAGRCHRHRAGPAPPGAAGVARAGRGLAAVRHGRRVPSARGDRPHQRARPDRADLARALVHRRVRRGAARDHRVGGADGAHHGPRLLHRRLRDPRRVRRAGRAGAGGRADHGAGRFGGPGHRPGRGPHAGRGHPGRPARGRARRLPPGSRRAAGRRHGSAGPPLHHGLAAALRHRSDRAAGDVGRAAGAGRAAQGSRAGRRDRPGRRHGAVRGPPRPVRDRAEDPAGGAGGRARGPGAGRGRPVLRGLPGVRHPLRLGRGLGPAGPGPPYPQLHRAHRAGRRRPSGGPGRPHPRRPPQRPHARRDPRGPPPDLPVLRPARRRRRVPGRPAGHPGGDDPHRVSRPAPRAPPRTRARAPSGRMG
ncbi:hypothetical protein SGPA1_10592 [Streptomyces misionensis JCM 4497]